MAPKEPTRHQLSSRLAYNQDTPAFLRRLKNKVSGTVSDEEEQEFEEWQAGSGRPPIPRRPTPPERPADDPGSANEDEGDEKPQVVVLREGRHLTAREAERYAENERRKARGLPPLLEDSKDEQGGDENDENSKGTKDKQKADGEANSKASMSFSSFGASSRAKSSTKKRKAIGDDLDEVVGKESKSKEKQASKGKKAKTGALLSFGEDES